MAGERRQLRGHSLVAGIAAVFLLAVCSSGGSAKPASSPTTGSGTAGTSAATTTAAGTSGNCFTPPGPQKARVRFVNLFTNSTYPASAVDVWQGFGGTDPCAKKLATVPFGSASDYVDVTATDSSGDWNATAYVAGSTAKDHQIITQSETWKGGEQVTITFQGAEPQPGSDLPASAGGDQAFFENTSSADTSALTPVAGKAVLGISGGSVQYVVKDGAWFADVAGHTGCLLAAGDTSSTRTDIGGTQLVSYAVDPGSIKLALYPSDPGTCAGAPAVGPVTFDAAAGSRTLVFVYGSDAQHLKLLVLPIAS